mmetsp:Transcript_62448/g.167195  ORF Transcript_62448/g.167195 Transcript_62448/m.167195 type:complete len:247 (-) Transcript_62448:17-757(-)
MEATIAESVTAMVAIVTAADPARNAVAAVTDATAATPQVPKHATPTSAPTHISFTSGFFLQACPSSTWLFMSWANLSWAASIKMLRLKEAGEASVSSCRYNTPSFSTNPVPSLSGISSIAASTACQALSRMRAVSRGSSDSGIRSSFATQSSSTIIAPCTSPASTRFCRAAPQTDSAGQILFDCTSEETPDCRRETLPPCRAAVAALRSSDQCAGRGEAAALISAARRSSSDDSCASSLAASLMAD